MPKNEVVQGFLSTMDNDKSKLIGIALNGKSIEPKQHVPKAEAQTIPTVSYAAANSSTTYLVVCLDIDAPFASWPVLPALHWIQPGLKVGADGILSSTDPFIADWAGPGPPPGAAAHRYVFLLFEQPEDFDLKKFASPGGKPVGLRPRMRYDLDAWLKTAGLGAPVAGNYFASN